MSAIVVVGSINRDIVAFVDRHPLPGETVLSRKTALYPGGKGANQAVAAARLRAVPEHQVRMVGRVGRDVFGEDMRQTLLAERIDVTGLTTTDAAATGLALITVDATGQNSIVVSPGANHAWEDQLPSLQLTPRDIVICQLEIPLPIVQAAFAQARASRAATILNPAPHQELPLDILACTDILVLNEIELAQMLGHPVTDVTDQSLIAALRRLLEPGPTAAIVTLGALGVLLVDAAGRAHRIPAQPVMAVDTTGAGDCFVGALAAQLLHERDLPAAAHFANGAAAISVTRAGAANAMPCRSDIKPVLLFNDQRWS